MSENLLAIHSKENLASKLKVNRYNWSLMNYYDYFKSNLKSILIVSLCTFALSFSFFFSKKYNTKITYTVNTNQSFESNILASSMFSKVDNSIFGNLIDRTYNHARSRHFFKSLAYIILQNPNSSYIFQKAITADFLKQIQAIDSSSFNEKLLIITDFLIERVDVQLRNENHIYFSITTDDPLLTESIQKLLNDRTKELLTKSPLEEIQRAASILSKELNNTHKILDTIDIKKIEIQQQHGSLDPIALAKTYSDLSFTLNKEKNELLAKLRASVNRIESLKRNLLIFPNNYSIQKEISSLRRNKVEYESKLESAQKSILELQEKVSLLPKLTADLKKIEREEEIQLKTVLRLNEQKSLADISIQKIEDSITLLTADENIKSSTSLVLLIKTLSLSFIITIVYIFALYYKQSYLPVIFSKEELENTGLKIITSLSKESKKYSFDSNLISANSIAINTIQAQVEKCHISSFICAGKTQDSGDIIFKVAKSLISKGKKVYVLSFNMKNKHRKKMRSLDFNLFEFNNINEKISSKSVLNIEKIQTNLDTRNSFDYILVDARRIKSFANKALIASISNETIAFCTINKTRYIDLNNFIKLHNILVEKMHSSISLVITRSKINDNISTYLNKNIKKKDTHENKKAS